MQGLHKNEIFPKILMLVYTAHYMSTTTLKHFKDGCQSNILWEHSYDFFRLTQAHTVLCGAKGNHGVIYLTNTVANLNSKQVALDASAI